MKITQKGSFCYTRQAQRILFSGLLLGASATSGGPAAAQRGQTRTPVKSAVPIRAAQESGAAQVTTAADNPALSDLVSEVEFFRLDKPTGDGRNALTLLRLDKGPSQKSLETRRIAATVGEVRTEFNDAGEGVDQEPDDGVFTALNRIDFAEMEKQEVAFLERLRGVKRPAIKTFSGRGVTGTIRVTADDLLRLKAQVPIRRIRLDDGVQAVSVASVFGVLKMLPFTAAENKVLAVNASNVVAHPGFTFDPCDTDGTGNDVNPNNPWSFKTLMSNLNQGTGLTDQQFIHEWLGTWMVSSTVNSFELPARTGITDYFVGWDGLNASTLDIDNLPFRLLAVVNRIDLAKVSYASSSEGEIRFVFGLLNPVTCLPAAGVDQMTAIFEYADTASSCSAIKNRAQEWLDLDTLALGSVAYMNALKAITDDVTEAPQAAAQLNQLRTNDFAFDGIGSLSDDWNLREFVVNAGSGLLTPTTTKQTPDMSFRTGSPVTAQYMEDNAVQILCETHEVPENYDGSPFLGANVEYLSTFFWSAPTNQGNLPNTFPGCHNSDASAVSGAVTTPTHIQSELRHKLSLNTCDDCHAQETDTSFTHVNPVTRALSGFMTGITVGDPLLGGLASGGIDRSFDDLQRRGQILEQLAVDSCGPFIFASDFFRRTVPRTFVH